MRKFNLYDKVTFIPEGETERRVGCIIGFETEEDGCIISKENGALVEPNEHSYIVIEGEVNGLNLSLTECLESELELVNE
ncbi:hypothetical protein D0T49_03560 [Paludibacter sp. 221]|uniref:hypothetical protein n=1 Tax=Paludibacter sp. 221 TaxID=2302939 RepID=UPI0013D3D853|nr:hypothetical protein [Paludibacter sp. 221]NDV46117.1 hypothetical protein [Paludibacter sp. 221]